MISLRGTYSYLNNEQIQIGDIEIMTSAYASSGSFGSIVRYKSILHNTYTGIRSNLCSKPTLIRGTLQKYGLNYSYSISHFSWLPQAVAKQNRLSQKVSYDYKIIDPVNNGISPNEVISHF